MTTMTRKADIIFTSSAIKSQIVSREFDAPRELVWKANTEPERMAQWFAPAGNRSFVKSMDLRVEGLCHYGQTTDDGSTTLYGRMIYTEVTPIERLAFIQSFSDEEGNIGTHPMAPTWPKEMQSVVTFHDLGAGRTRMTVSWTPHNATPEEIATFDSARDGITGGWKGTFDHLTTYLATAQH